MKKSITLKSEMEICLVLKVKLRSKEIIGLNWKGIALMKATHLILLKIVW